jgi:hypothetical protein
MNTDNGIRIHSRLDPHPGRAQHPHHSRTTGDPPIGRVVTKRVFDECQLDVLNVGVEPHVQTRGNRSNDLDKLRQFMLG